MESTDKQSSKAVEAALDQLEFLIETAQGYAANMEHKARDIEEYDTTELPIKDVGKEMMKTGYLPRLLKLIQTLSDVNDRNKETLIHLDRLL